MQSACAVPYPRILLVPCRNLLVASLIFPSGVPSCALTGAPPGRCPGIPSSQVRTRPYTCRLRAPSAKVSWHQIASVPPSRWRGPSVRYTNSSRQCCDSLERARPAASTPRDARSWGCRSRRLVLPIRQIRQEILSERRQGEQAWTTESLLHTRQRRPCACS